MVFDSGLALGIQCGVFLVSYDRWIIDFAGFVVGYLVGMVELMFGTAYMLFNGSIY